MEERRQEGEVSFLTVASRAPRRESVVEPATCPCGTRFYRAVAPAKGEEKQRWCRECQEHEAMRQVSCSTSKWGARPPQFKLDPHASTLLRNQVKNKLRRASH